MNYEKFIMILDRMDNMIRKRSTGAPADFAAKLSVSERSLYYYLSLMKRQGAPLYYSRNYGSYLYREEGHMELVFNREQDTEHAC